ncbi:MAG TPA: hypothetical protein VFW40_04050 [Capsulimonadaceae bacterium]|nr:hypothetical protein [Capsulimonadaceae bacterium]
MLIRRASSLALFALILCSQAPALAGMVPNSTPTPAETKIVLKEPLTAENSAEFAKKLSTLVGATVSLPSVSSVKLTIPAGSYSADELLGETVKQLSTGSGGAVTLRRSFVLTRPSAEKNTPSCLLGSPGKITVSVKDALFADTTQAIVKQVRCDVETPSYVHGRYTLQLTKVPIEQAMRLLASQARLVVAQQVRIDIGAQLLGAGQTDDTDAMAGSGDDNQGDDEDGNDDEAAVSADAGSGGVNLDIPSDMALSGDDLMFMSEWSLEQANKPDGTDDVSFGQWLFDQANGADSPGPDSGSQ